MKYQEVKKGESNRTLHQILGNLICSREPSRYSLHELYLSSISKLWNEVSGTQWVVQGKVEYHSTMQIRGNILCSIVPARCTLYEVYFSRISDG